MKKTILLLSILLVASCAFPASKQGMTVTDLKSSKKIGEKIFVKESKGGSTTLPFWTSEISDENFTFAVRESLINSQAFSELSSKWEDDWGLEIEILNVDQPLVGIDFTVKTQVKYTLYKKGKKAYETTVYETGKATPTDTIFAVARLRIANEKSAKANIAKFVEDLSRNNF